MLRIWSANRYLMGAAGHRSDWTSAADLGRAGEGRLLVPALQADAYGCTGGKFPELVVLMHFG